MWRLKEVEHLLEHPSSGSSQGVESADDGQHSTNAVLADRGAIRGQKTGPGGVLFAVIGLHKAHDIGFIAAACEAGQVNCHC